MASSLITHKRINTTLAKAKALRQFVEPLISRSKDDSTHSRRMVFRKLQSKEAVSELFREVSPKVADRPGGYTRIIKTGNRLGDNAEMAMIELVDFNDLYVTEKKAKSSKRTRRSRRSGGSEAAAAPAAEATTEATEAPEAAATETAAAAEATEAPAAEAEETPKAEAPEAPASSEDEASDSKEGEEEKPAE